MRLLFVGFGQVGRALARMLVERDGVGFSVVGIVTARHGACFNPDGIDLALALAAESEIAQPGSGDVVDAATAATTLDYDVLVEMTPLSVAGRGEPALGTCRTALARGRHVVTCNKGPIAWGLTELSGLAADHGVELLCESTVMDGAPVFNLRRHCLRGLRIAAVEGILNSTTNVAIGGIERGLSLDEALREAQRLGIAEADPGHDIDGWDAAVKLSVLSNLLLEAPLVPEHVSRQSLRDVAPETIRAAERNGTPVRMVCRAEAVRGLVEASVRAEEVPAGSSFAAVRGASSLLRLRTELPGAFAIVEEEPTVETTAYGVLSDLLSLRPSRPS